MKRTKLPLALTVLTAASLFQIPSVARADEPIKILIDGVEQHYDSPPVLKNDRTLVPLRGILESLGGTVYWNGYDQEIDVKKGNSIITLRIGNKVATVEARETQLDQPPEVINDRTMVPLRFLAESVGANVQWDGTQNAVVIKTSTPAPAKKDFNGLIQPGVRSDLDVDNDDEIQAMVLRQLSEGLVRLDGQGKPTAGVAKEWKVSPDGLTYTFTLRDDAKWNNGSPVTAQDFIQGFQESLKLKSTASQFILFLKNGFEVAKGEKSLDQLGAVAKNEHTLVLTLTAPSPNFLDILTREAYYPSRQVGEMSLSNGAFQLYGMTYGRAVEFRKNPFYWDRDHVQVDQAHFLWAESYKNDGVDDLYRLGFADRMNIPQPFYSGFKNNSDRVIDPLFDVNYLSFNLANAALGNNKIRQALTYALDNETIAASFENGVDSPAHRMLAPGMDLVDVDLLHQKENAPRAKQLLTEGLKEAGLTQLPTLTLTVWEGSGQVAAAQVLQQQWKQNLGVDVAVKKLPQQEQVIATVAKNYDIAWLNSPAESTDMPSYLGTFMSDSTPFNVGGYNNKQFDQLIIRANQEGNATKRASLVRDAETLLLSDAAVVPLTHTNLLSLQKPYVKGFTLYPTLPAFDLKYVSVEGK